MRLERRESLRRLVALSAAGALSGCGLLAPRERLNIVLVHGGYHGAWCWERIVPLLREQGHEVNAVELPGRGGDRTPFEKIDAAAYAKAVTDVLDVQRAAAVLVGHSSSGLVISRAAEARPERIRTLVFLSAFVMRDGEAWRPGQDPGTKVTPILRVEFRPGTKIPMQTRIDVSKPDAVKLAFYNDCDERDARAAIARLVPEPPRPLGEPLRLSAQRFGSVDKVYIFCSKDNAVSPKRQQEFAAKWLLRRSITLDSGHSPFLSMPGRLAQVLGAELYA